MVDGFIRPPLPGFGGLALSILFSFIYLFFFYNFWDLDICYAAWLALLLFSWFKRGSSLQYL